MTRSVILILISLLSNTFSQSYDPFGDCPGKKITAITTHMEHKTLVYSIDNDGVYYYNRGSTPVYSYGESSFPDYLKNVKKIIYIKHKNIIIVLTIQGIAYYDYNDVIIVMQYNLLLGVTKN